LQIGRWRKPRHASRCAATNIRVGTCWIRLRGVHVFAGRWSMRYRAVALAAFLLGGCGSPYVCLGESDYGRRKPKTAQERVEDAMRELQEVIELTPQQKSTIRLLFDEESKAAEASRSSRTRHASGGAPRFEMGTYDRRAEKDALTRIRKLWSTTDAKVEAVLTEDQVEQYQRVARAIHWALNPPPENRRPSGGRRRGGRPGGMSGFGQGAAGGGFRFP